MTIVTTIIQQIPCVFAKSLDGVMKTHYVKMFLDSDTSLKYLSCECEESHGTDVVGGITELGGLSCFTVVDQLRKIINGGGDIGALLKNNEAIPFLRHAATQIYTHSFDVRASRRRNPAFVFQDYQSNPHSWKVTALDNIIQRKVGNPFLKIASFGTKSIGLYLGESSFSSVETSSMYFDDAVAVRNQDGIWENRNTPSVTKMTSIWMLRRGEVPEADRERFCGVCRSYFERIRKHLSGRKHRDMLVEHIRQAKRFTSRDSLVSQNWILNKRAEQRYGR